MGKPNFYVLEEVVRSYDIGPDQRIKMRPLLQYLQEAAARHARQAGDTFDRQIRQGAVWVLSRLHVRMDRYPHWHERLRIETWSVGIKSFSAIRDFRIEDESGICGAATTQWVLMNIDKRRPVRIPASLQEGYGRRPERELDDPFKPLPTFENPQHERVFAVRRGDLDPLNHVNYPVAVEWCLESLPAERVNGLRLASVEVAFKKESVYGDELLAQSAEPMAQASSPCVGPDSDQSILFLHRLVRRSDDAIAIAARSRWVVDNLRPRDTS